MVLLDLDREQVLEGLRLGFDMSVSSRTRELLATRGDRLALFRMHWELAHRSIGPSEIEWLDLIEVDDHGNRIAGVTFDADDLDAAYTELDDRYGVGEAAPNDLVWTAMRGFLRALAARDWNALSALFAPDLVFSDDVGFWPTLHGPAAYVDLVKSLVDLAPDARLRLDHMRMCDRGALFLYTFSGTRDGGAFEISKVAVNEYDRLGIHRFTGYDLARLDAALARFEALRASAPRDPLAALARPNAATVAMDRLQAAFEARDWAAARALFAEEAKIEDRRRLFLGSSGAEVWIAEMQMIARERPDAHYDRQLVGTAGGRVDLERVLWAGGPEGGRFEVADLRLTEVGAAGRITAIIAFDLDDGGAGHADAFDRASAVDRAAATLRPVYEFFLGVNDRDLARVRAALADDLVVDDHRLEGMGRLEGADAYLESLSALLRLVPDAQLDKT